MGCDIHVYLEQLEGEHANSVAQFSAGRNYQMFALMAGVRSDGDEPVVEPRGMPENMGWWARSDYVIYPDENHKVGQIARWVESGSSIWIDKDRGCASGPDWHSASWLTTAEMEQVKAAYEQREFSRAGWYQNGATLSEDRQLHGAKPEDVTISLATEGIHKGYYHVEIGPKTKAVFPPGYAALLAAMQALGDGARIVFWFDN